MLHYPEITYFYLMKYITPHFFTSISITYSSLTYFINPFGEKKFIRGWAS